MQKNKSVFVFLLLCFFVPSSFAGENDFDKVCGYFTELQITLKHKSLTNQQRTKFMNNLIDRNFDAKTPISVEWHAILSAVPDQRYMIFKESAKEVGRINDWQCAPMKALYPTVGY